MSRNASKRVSFSPDVNDKPSIFPKHGGGTRVAGGRKRVIGIWTFRLPKDSSGFSTVDFLQRLQVKVVRAIRFMSMRRRSSRKVSSSLVRSRSVSDPIDSHRAEAIEDCIEFLNSSSCLQRSNSVSAGSC
ncbi:hypothetical protein I3760_09G206800 [Carya illinoinensis]|uniref:Josephin-like protein n=1 Tax=Carya illinoinensis TaxID=32201 RepID=A0A8T1PKG8_CARIL|nr:hypothetical protein I3760_09G206800 [Carya illinoinensis]KAG6643375.1 hypothetical protein CIPAW_09G207200 [Carya illinoinensis]